MALLTPLFEDDHFVAFHKPSGLVVHKSHTARDRITALRAARNQLGHWVYPVHRLDRGTCGVLIFGKNSESASRLAPLFERREVHKTYQAIVRGWTEDEGVIDHPLRNKDAPKNTEDPAEAKQTAITLYRTLAKVELEVAVGKYSTARYSWVELEPQTGRQHQIRRHLRHLAHPIIGDRQYGDRAHNQYFEQHKGCTRLLLSSTALSFIHPFRGEKICIQTQPSATFREQLKRLGLVSRSHPIGEMVS